MNIEDKKKQIAGRMKKRPVRHLSEAEQKEKTKNWPKGGFKEPNHLEYQKKFGRAYND